MDEQKQIEDALDHLKAIVQLNLSIGVLMNTDIQKMIGFLMFQLWIRENVDK